MCGEFIVVGADQKRADDCGVVLEFVQSGGGPCLNEFQLPYSLCAGRLLGEQVCEAAEFPDVVAADWTVLKASGWSTA
jgi:hypothetical protein